MTAELCYLSGPPPSRPVLGKRRARMVTEPLTVGYYYGERSRRITVPPGFVHDGPSIPRWLLWLEPRTNAMYRAAVIHDFIYVYHHVPRREADDVYHCILIHDGLDAHSAFVHWQAIRVFGRWWW